MNQGHGRLKLKCTHFSYLLFLLFLLSLRFLFSINFLVLLPFSFTTPHLVASFRAGFSSLTSSGGVNEMLAQGDHTGTLTIAAIATRLN
jgi:hypothetical protein